MEFVIASWFLQMEFLQKLGKNPSNKYGAALNELANEHRMAIEAIEMQLRKEHNIQCQVPPKT